MNHSWLRRLWGLAVVGGALLCSAVSLGEPSLGEASRVEAPSQTGWQRFLMPGGGKQLPLHAEISGGSLWAKACAAGCSARQGTAVVLPPGVEGAQGQFRALQINPQSKVLLWSAPLKAVQGQPAEMFQVLMASAIDGSASEKILYAESTVEASQLLRKKDGLEVRSAVLQVKSGKNGLRIVSGEVLSEVNLCGRPTLLAPRLLVAKDLSFHASKLQRLSREERQAAVVLVMQPLQGESHESPAVRLVQAVASSSAIGGPESLTDGDPQSHWSEARGGTGRGEFVLFRANRDAGLAALDILVRGALVEDAQGVAPRVMWLATSDQLYRLDWQQDAWQVPGRWFRATFPQPLYTNCLSLVLERGQREEATARLTLTEVRGISPFAELSVGQLLEKLGEAGEVGDAAAAFLQVAGVEALQQLVRSFPRLQGLARERAWAIVGRGSCGATAPLLAKILTNESEAERKRAVIVLERCDSPVQQALQSEYRSLPPKSRLMYLQQLPGLAPALTIELSLELLSKASPREAMGVRDVLFQASRGIETEVSEAEASGAEPSKTLDALRLALADETHTLSQKLHLLRAVGETMARLEVEHNRAVLWALSRAKSFEERYWLLAPLGKLVALKKGSPAPRMYKFLLANMRDPDPLLRARAVSFAPSMGLFGERLRSLMSDPQVRVREAAVRRAAVFEDALTEGELLVRLKEDKWPLVRKAATQSLAVQGQSESVDRQLAVTVARDDSAMVRVAAIVALGKRQATQFVETLAERFRNKQEQPLVRAAAAKALAAFCDISILPDLTRAVHRLTRLPVSESSQILGRASLKALGILAPADLRKRLAPLLGPKIPAVVRSAAEAILASAGTCPKLVQR